MIDIILSLIDRLISLVKHQEEVKRNLFKEFIEPIFENFENVHKNYLDTFSEYKTLVGKTEVILNGENQLLEKIKNDSLFSANLRAKLTALRHLEDDPTFGSFVTVILLYLKIASESPTRGYSTPAEELSGLIMSWIPSGGNRVRSICHNSLLLIMKKNISEKEKKQEATMMLDCIAHGLQDRFSTVAEEYEKLKVKLLLPT